MYILGGSDKLDIFEGRYYLRGVSLGPLNIFILKNLDSMSNEMLFRVLGSKFGMGYLKFLEKDRKKLLKDH